MKVEHKYLVRPSDFMVWSLNTDGKTYSNHEHKSTIENCNCDYNYDHFNYENLTKNYGWIEIKESEVKKFTQLCNEHYARESRRMKNDGHGGCYYDETIK
jgi:murein tripeptide amidase MpaA